VCLGRARPAVAAYDAALSNTQQRVQFGRPLASFQLVQDRLVKMLADVTAMQLYCNSGGSRRSGR
jgi:glutaryl-CoA dehydrogenase